MEENDAKMNAGWDNQCGNEPIRASAEGGVSGGESGCSEQGCYGASEGGHVLAANCGECSTSQAPLDQSKIWRIPSV